MSLLTEAEAKDMWCPQAKQTGEGYGTYNRDGNGNGDLDCRCLASGCVCWRWGEPLPCADHGRKHAEIKETPEYLNVKLKEVEEPDGLNEDGFVALIDDIQKKYTENPLPRPDDVPDSWEYHVDFCEWYEDGCVQWIESDETAKPRAAAKRRGYCGLAGKLEVA